MEESKKGRRHPQQTFKMLPTQPPFPVFNHCALHQLLPHTFHHTYPPESLCIDLAPLAIHCIYSIPTISPTCCLFVVPFHLMFASPYSLYLCTPHLFTHLALFHTSSTETHCVSCVLCQLLHEPSQHLQYGLQPLNWRTYLIILARSNKSCSQECCKANLHARTSMQLTVALSI